MNEYFEKAFSFTLKSEGAYTNDPKDPGGETKFGISKKSYPGEDIKNLTIERAKEIYYKDFWILSNCDKLVSLGYPLTAIALFDGSVNCGISTSKKFIQRFLKVTDDGILGPNTLGKLSIYSDSQVVEGILIERKKYYDLIIIKNPNLEKFRNGWNNRIKELGVFLSK